MTAVFSSEIMQAKRQWNDIFTVLKEKLSPPGILYSATLYFQTEDKILFQTNRKPREFIARRPEIQELLKEVIQEEE